MTHRIATALAIAAAIAATNPANAQQATASATTDSLKKIDNLSAGDVATPSTTSRARSLFHRATSAAASAAKTVERTAESKQELAQTALLFGAKSNPGVMMMKQMLEMQKRDQAEAARAQAARAARSGAAMATLSASMAGMGKQAQGIVSHAASVSQSGMPAASGADDPAFAAVYADYLSLVTRASSGDRTAAEQLERFGREMSLVSTQLATLPAAQQQAAYTNALRDGITCATKGKGCRAR